jgi:hypothetical protein
VTAGLAYLKASFGIARRSHQLPFRQLTLERSHSVLKALYTSYKTYSELALKPLSSFVPGLENSLVNSLLHVQLQAYLEELMHRAHVIRLNPTPEQALYFRKACGVARHCYNWALSPTISA